MYISQFKAIILHLHKSYKSEESASWLYWLKETKSESVESIYNRLQYPKMLTWLVRELFMRVGL